MKTVLTKRQESQDEQNSSRPMNEIKLKIMSEISTVSALYISIFSESFIPVQFIPHTNTSRLDRLETLVFFRLQFSEQRDTCT